MGGPAQKALLDEFRLSLTQAQSSDLYAKVREKNPDANSTELAKNLRAAMLAAALEARRKKIQEEKDVRAQVGDRVAEQKRAQQSVLEIEM